jgi:predicted secreted protein
MPTNTYYSGKTGTITVPGVSALAVVTWTADHEQEIIDVSNKSSAGYHESIAGLQKLTGSADCVYDGYHIFPGTLGAFTLNFPDTSTITGNCWITKVAYESPTAGAVTIKLDFEASGTFTVGGS